MVKLEDVAEISLGTIFTRVSGQERDDAVSLDTISMQEVSYYVGKYDVVPEPLCSIIDRNKISNCIFTKVNDVIIGLTSRNAMVIDYSRENKLVLSNFLRIRIHDTNSLDPMYLCWLINESKDVTKLFESNKQGSALVHVLKANEVREMMLELPNIKIQQKIGKIYSLGLQSEKISKTIISKKNMLLQKILNDYKEKFKDEN